jgi:hypothetical protein
MAKHTANPETILSTLSPEAASVLENHFRQRFVSELSAGLPGNAKPAKRSGQKASVRQRTADGRSASQFIRDCDDNLSAKDVVAKAAEAGLTVKESLVYNVRQQARKKAEASDKDEQVKKDETYQKRLKALEKARAKRAENRAAAEKAKAKK